MDGDTCDELRAKLAAPFDVADVKWKPAMVKNNRALALAYINARAVMDRLDDAVGVEGWSDQYEIASNGSVICRLTVKIDGEWIQKADVGSMSEQPDEGDRLKSAFSDALKRTAVKFGVGRYLYRLQSQWCDYDGVKKQFTSTPSLPPWAIPQKAQATQPAQQKAAAKPAQAKAALPEATAAVPAEIKPPGTVAELRDRIEKCEVLLITSKLAVKGQLWRHVEDSLKEMGFDKMDWEMTPQNLHPKEPDRLAKFITCAVESVKGFLALSKAKERMGANGSAAK